MAVYSKYASAARAAMEEKERAAAEREGRNREQLNVNEIGPARTFHAAKQGRRRIAGYSVARQGGRDEARARAEERKQGAFARLNEARSRSFGGLKEMDAMNSNPDFARAKTPALDAAFGKKDPEPLKSSDPRGAQPDMGPRGKMGAYVDRGPRGTMGEWKPKPLQSTPQAPSPAPLPGFPAPTPFDPLKNRSGGQVVSDEVENALRQPRRRF
jgi:hypothetical protein